MTRINHTGHGHPNTPAARAACRKLMAEHDATPAIQSEATIDTPAGPVRVGSVVLIDVRGERRGQYYTIDEISDDIKNGRPGVQAKGAPETGRDCWAYVEQITKVIKF